ncbi:hypothetical protein [Clostridium butyricum]|uniref:hypothetical protein n=1 Tax=Clostridium butyricum TaxID=1492 RepID=UPI0018AAF7FE|nr:hypothetical protein [Clostridium butyricum]
MIKNDLYNELTDIQKDILNRSIEENSFEECNPNDVKLNIYLEEIDDRMTSESPFCMDFEIYNDILRYLNSQLNDIEIRKQKLLEEANKKYLEEQKYIDEAISEGMVKEKDILLHAVKMEDNIIKCLGIDYGFTEKQVLKLFDFQLNMCGINEKIQF